MTETDRKVDLKNRWLAGLLALAFPGLGHLYQGRFVKAAVYCGCIMTLFLWGQALGGWKIVYVDSTEAVMKLQPRQRLGRRVLQGYGAQFFAGLPAWGAMLQQRRFVSRENIPQSVLVDPIDAPFRGEIDIDFLDGEESTGAEIRGRIRLGFEGEKGVFTGFDAEGEPIEIPLDGLKRLEEPVRASADREIELRVPRTFAEQPNVRKVELDGVIPRSILNWYQVPLDDELEDRLHLRFGSGLEIAFVFTWIAGLLNIFAVWDAFEGPAYGRGDEPELQPGYKAKKDEPKSSDGDEPDDSESAAEPATADSASG
ncbi:DUF6677 family protein [Stratiformator vulcanicus]|uniref:DUF6677 domain-containing protein n=1 Tax=Stratiformator vulcanicus TaxID=2527980 RepID=A0A517R4I4_9PLAN|nr:DUF6677 family protein [Stratiformator vulcanicus]QDT38788.1 hypothetical protein Pan189_31870 [Stratiformator vulcanicus]